MPSRRGVLHSDRISSPPTPQARVSSRTRSSKWARKSVKQKGVGKYEHHGVVVVGGREENMSIRYGTKGTNFKECGLRE